MSDLLKAARAALPGLDWTPVDSERCGWFTVAATFEVLPAWWSVRIDLADDGSTLATIAPGGYPKAFDDVPAAAQWLRAQVEARRDALTAALGDAPQAVDGRSVSATGARTGASIAGII